MNATWFTFSLAIWHLRFEAKHTCADSAIFPCFNLTLYLHPLDFYCSLLITRGDPGGHFRRKLLTRQLLSMHLKQSIFCCGIEMVTCRNTHEVYVRKKLKVQLPIKLGFFNLCKENDLENLWLLRRKIVSIEHVSRFVRRRKFGYVHLLRSHMMSFFVERCVKKMH